MHLSTSIITVFPLRRIDKIVMCVCVHAHVCGEGGGKGFTVSPSALIQQIEKT